MVNSGLYFTPFWRKCIFSSFATKFVNIRYHKPKLSLILSLEASKLHARLRIDHRLCPLHLKRCPAAIRLLTDAWNCTCAFSQLDGSGQWFTSVCLRLLSLFLCLQYPQHSLFYFWDIEVYNLSDIFYCLQSRCRLRSKGLVGLTKGKWLDLLCFSLGRKANEYK